MTDRKLAHVNATPIAEGLFLWGNFPGDLVVLSRVKSKLTNLTYTKLLAYTTKIIRIKIGSHF